MPELQCFVAVTCVMSKIFKARTEGALSTVELLDFMGKLNLTLAKVPALYLRSKRSVTVVFDFIEKPTSCCLDAHFIKQEDIDFFNTLQILVVGNQCPSWIGQCSCRLKHVGQG